MEISKIDESISICPQISPNDLASIKKLGFKSVINNRPDGEEPGQPLASQIQEQCEANGLEYRHLPVVNATMGEPEANQMKVLMEELPKPVFAFCRSGTRSKNLYAMSLKV